MPSSTKPGNPTVYGGGSVTYTCTDGGSTTKIYNEVLAHGIAPEILIGKTQDNVSGSFAISGIPTGKAAVMTLTFRSNKFSVGYCTVSSGTTGISVGTQTISSKDTISTCDITNTGGVESFDLTITNTLTQNSREDNFLLVVKTAGGTPEVTTTYYTTSPDCSEDPSPATPVDNTSVGSPARKLLINGQLFILRDGHLYTVQGVRVQ